MKASIREFEKGILSKFNEAVCFADKKDEKLISLYNEKIKAFNEESSGKALNDFQKLHDNVLELFSKNKVDLANCVKDDVKMGFVSFDGYNFSEIREDREVLSEVKLVFFAVSDTISRMENVLSQMNILSDENLKNL